MFLIKIDHANRMRNHLINKPNLIYNCVMIFMDKQLVICINSTIDNYYHKFRSYLTHS